jgi:tetratricopeptide (TPR) repeat protein
MQGAGSTATVRERAAELYELNRFVDAWTVVRAELPELPPAANLEIEDLVLASRLAGRLGASKLRRHFQREALRRAPTDPRVLYFARDGRRLTFDILAHLQELEEMPRLPTDDPALQACWLASQAVSWAWVRDFERAHVALRAADELGQEHAWVATSRADVLVREDRWFEALDAVNAAWRLAPGMPAAAEVLGRVLVRLDRLDEAVERLMDVAAMEQSYEVMLLAVWHACAQAERRPESERRQLAERGGWPRVRALQHPSPTATRSRASHVHRSTQPC